MECPVCFDYMRPPIYMCNGGHSICSKCKPNLKKCPTCTLAIGDLRNFSLETITGEAYFSCENKDVGCPERLKISDMQVHLKQCSFRKCACPRAHLDCTWKGSKLQRKLHVKDNHQIFQNIFPTFFVDLQGRQRQGVHFLEVYDKLFSWNWKYADNMLYTTVQYLEDVENADNYFYEIKVVTKTNKKFIVSHICLDETLTVSETLQGESCLVIPLRLFKLFKENNVVLISIVIFKCE